MPQVSIAGRDEAWGSKGTLTPRSRFRHSDGLSPVPSLFEREAAREQEGHHGGLEGGHDRVLYRMLVLVRIGFERERAHPKTYRAQAERPDV